jgi:hypothetical protein
VKGESLSGALTDPGQLAELGDEPVDWGYITGEAIGIDGGFGLNTFSLGRQERRRQT